jgi:hypothetical protein
MSFWDLSDGQTAVDTPKDYEAAGGGSDGFEPIPEKSSVLAIIDQAKWTENDGAKYIELRWTIMGPDEFKNRKVFHKVWVTDLEPRTLKDKGEAKAIGKRDNARRMLAGIDAIAGGNLTRTGVDPTEETMMMHIANRPMVITLEVATFTRQNGEPGAVNWVRRVQTADSTVQISSEPLPKTSAPSTPSGGGGYGGGLSDSDIPF